MEHVFLEEVLERTPEGMLHLPGLCPLVASPGLDILPLRITDHSLWLCHKTGGLLQTNVCLCPPFCLFKEIRIDPAHTCVQSDMTEEEHASTVSHFGHK